MKEKTIAWVMAHPDDETFSSGAAIRCAANKGHRPIYVCATPGDAGKTGRLGEMSKEELAQKRKVELREAGDLLGLDAIHHLDYPDGKLKDAPFEELVRKIAALLNEEGAEIAVTFPQNGFNGHPDHIAIHFAAKEAVASGLCPQVKKLYVTQKESGLEASFGVSAAPYWETKRRALLRHESQIFSVERAFGDVARNCELPEAFAEEAFALIWENGAPAQAKKEAFFTDGL